MDTRLPVEVIPSDHQDAQKKVLGGLVAISIFHDIKLKTLYQDLSLRSFIEVKTARAVCKD